MIVEKKRNKNRQRELAKTGFDSRCEIFFFKNDIDVDILELLENGEGLCRDMPWHVPTNEQQ